MNGYTFKTKLEHANAEESAKYRRAIEIVEAMTGEHIPDGLELEASEGMVSEYFMNNFGELR